MKNIILDNSKKMFYEVGYFKTDISNIIKKCGISTDSFYMHYDSKEDLLVKIIRKDLEVYRNKINYLIPKKEDASLKMEMLIRTILNFLKKNPFFFVMLSELEEDNKKLSPTTQKWLKQFWTETRSLTMKFLKSWENLGKDSRELLPTLIEGQLKTYIRHLLIEDPDKLLSLGIEGEIARLSTLVINTCHSLNIHTSGETIAPLTEPNTNKEFFKLFEEARSSGKPLHLIFLDLKIFSATGNPQKIFLRDSILADIETLLKKYFRGTDLVDRISSFKFTVLVTPENPIPEKLESRMEKLIVDLQSKYSFISIEHIPWKLLNLNSGEDLFKNFINLRPLQENYCRKNSG